MNKKNSHGFTLIEMLLFMGIFMILLLVLTDIFSSSLELQKETESTSEVQQNVSFIINRLSYDISRADDIIIPASPGTVTDSLQVLKNSDNQTYQLNNNQLILTDNIGSDRLNSMNTLISNLQFTRLGNENGKNTISVDFTVTGINIKKSGPESKSYNFTVGVR